MLHRVKKNKGFTQMKAMNREFLSVTPGKTAVYFLELQLSRWYSGNDAVNLLHYYSV